MLGKLLLAFIVIPLVEFFLLVWLAEQTSILTTVLLVVVTGVIGSLVARQQGIRAWQRFRLAAAEGRMPGREIQDGLLIAFAAALLLTPGLLTDTLGFVLLFPRTREWIRKRIAQRFSTSFRVQMYSRSTERSTVQGDPSGHVDPTYPHRVSRGDTVDAVNVRRVPR